MRAADWGSYLTVPFREGGCTRSGADCWGLVQLVHQEATGRCPPAVRRHASHEHAAIASELAAHEPLWRPVLDMPQALDVALFLGDPFHVGVLCDSETMLHTERGSGPVIESYRSSRWGNRLLGIYRYAG